MHSVVIADTSCFILLTKIDETEILCGLYANVYTTPEVAAEFKNKLPDWVIVEEVKNRQLVQSLQVELDLGEASAIALSYELPDPIIILDDLAARRVAAKLKIAFSGTFGIIIKAKEAGVIMSVKPILEKIRHTNFRISEDVVMEILRMAGEL